MKSTKQLVFNALTNIGVGIFCIAVATVTIAYLTDSSLDKEGLHIHKPQAIMPLTLLIALIALWPSKKQLPFWRWILIAIVIDLAMRIYLILSK